MKEQSHYEILEVSKTATEGEIKAAFRAKTIIYHPDKNGGDVAMFLKVRSAYEVLKDKKKRKAYDDTLFNQTGPTTHSSQEGGWWPAYFGQKKKTAERLNIALPLELTLEQIAFGTGNTLEIKYLRNIICPACQGGDDDNCIKCSGEGFVSEECVAQPSIPPGAVHGDEILVNNKGHQDLFTGDFGNLILTVREIAHSKFRHLGTGRTLTYSYFVSLIELINQEIKIKTLYSEVIIKITPAEIGIYKVILGHGLPFWDSDKKGDLNVNLYLRLPDPENLTPREKTLIKLLSETKNFKKQ